MLLFVCRLYERLMEEDQAAAAYTEYVNESERQAVSTTCNKKALFKVTKSTVSFCTMGLPGLYFLGMEVSFYFKISIHILVQYCGFEGNLKDRSQSSKYWKAGFLILILYKYC